MGPPPPESIPAAVVDALARADVEALQKLSTMSDKLVSKAAKRALHRLRARGVSIPERATPAASAAVLAAAPLEVREPVWATTVDSGGTRDLFLPLKAARGFDLHLATLSDERGVLRLNALPLSRRQLHVFMAELPSEARETLREIPLAEAGAILSAAIALDPAGRETSAARELLRLLPPSEPPVAPDLGAPTDAGLALRESAALFETPALRGYIPPQEVVLAVGQKLEEVLQSPLLVDEAQRLTQLRHALERAEADYFTAERRKIYSARLLDAAELFASRGEGSSASQARAVGIAFASDVAIHEIPFAREMFERIFDLEAAEKALRRPTAAVEREPLPGKLIVPP